MASWLSDTLTCACDASSRAASALTSAREVSSAVWLTSCCFTSASLRSSLRRASASRTSISVRLRREASSSRSAIVRMVAAVYRIEAREHLVLLHLHAFFDVDLEHLARDLRRHRGHAPRDHVTRGVEHRISQTRASWSASATTVVTSVVFGRSQSHRPSRANDQRPPRWLYRDRVRLPPPEVALGAIDAQRTQ